MLNPKQATIDYLQKPQPLAELDAWVAYRLSSKNRFSFKEEEVLEMLWKQGQEIRLREDNRFHLIGKQAPLHWRLSHHRLANTTIYNLLLDETWDGRDLIAVLANLDRESKSSAFHIFYTQDNRFDFTHKEPNLLDLTLKALTEIVELTAEQRELLARFIPSLLNIKALWNISEMLEALQRVDASKTINLATLESWLLTQAGWQRVSLDLWLATDHLPVLSPTSTRYAVLPIAGSRFEPIDFNTQPEETLDELDLKFTSNIQEFKDIHELEADRDLQRPVSWRVTLRTYQLNEGILQVPKRARAFYPHALKLSSSIVLRGLWYEDAQELDIWLDRSRHKLFGPALLEKLEVLGAGIILEISWNQNNIVISQVGEDTMVAQEETRLIDLDSLAQTRLTHLESYRASLRAILQESPSNFTTVHEQICTRQQHTVNTNTLRTILSASPEFTYHSATRLWSLNPSLTPEKSARSLRHLALISQANQINSVGTKQILQSVLQSSFDSLKAFEKQFYQI